MRWSLENITMHSIVFIVFFNPKARFTHAFGQQTLEARSNRKLKKCVREIGLPFPCSWITSYSSMKQAPLNLIQLIYDEK